MTDTLNENKKLKSKFDYKDLRYIVDIAKDTNHAALYLAELLQSFNMINRDSSSVVSASEELSVSIKDISSTVHVVSDDATNAENIINQSINTADNAINAMQQIANTSVESSQQIDKLAETSKNITQILKMISDISKQTHLLALNATIEAARAGDAGKGFTVVAKEVKNLAEQTSRATDDIRMHTEKLNSDMGDIMNITARNTAVVNEGQQLISDTVSLLKSSASTVGEVSHKMQEVTVILDQQSIATKEIAENISNVANATTVNMQFAEDTAKSITVANETIKAGIGKYSENQDNKTLCELTKFDHILFKKRVIDTFLGILDTKSEDLPDHNTCRLGIWYNGITDPKIKNLPEFNALYEPHILVHQYGKEALDCLHKGDTKCAIEKIKELDKVSDIVLDILTKLADKM